MPQERSILWVDGVGGFLVCMGRSITIGQAAPGNCLDVPVLGDLSSLHATISRDGEGYVVQTQRDVYVNGRPVGQAALRDGDEIRLGRKVQMLFRMPCPLSGTATLTLVSGHRLHLALSAIVLLAETCLIGPSEQAHIPVPDSATTLTLYRQPDGLWCRTEGELEIDGRAYDGRGPLRPGSHAVAGELSFSVESLNWPLNQL